MKIKLLDSIADQAREINAADLGDTPIYFARWETLGPEFQFAGKNCGREVAGYTTARLDLLLRPELEAAGIWRGRGLAAVLWPMPNDLAHLRIALHETAHAVADDFDFSDAEAETIPLRSVSDGAFEEEKRQRAAPNPPAPWTGHDWRFTFAALLMGFRSERFDANLYPSSFDIAGPTFGLSHDWNYAATIDHDTRERVYSGESIRSILADGAPRAFMDLWNADTSKYLRFEKQLRSWPTRAALYDYWQREIDDASADGADYPAATITPALAAAPGILPAVALAASPLPDGGEGAPQC